MATALMTSLGPQRIASALDAESSSVEPIGGPPLGLRVEGESPVSRQVLEEEIGRAVGRPVVAAGEIDDGVVVIHFVELAAGALEVHVRYEPPPEQLVREALVEDTSAVALRVAELVQSLLRQDAGVTVVSSPPPPSKPTPSLAEATSAPPESPRETSPAPPASEPALRSWQLRGGLRWTPSGAVAGRGRDAAGRLGDLSVIGGSLQLLSPTGGRLRLGLEAVYDHVDVEGSLNGQNASLSGGYVGISAMSLLTLLRTKHGFEANAAVHLGVVSADFELQGFTAAYAQTQSDVGYRAGLALDVSYWFNERLAISGGIGLEEVVVDVDATRLDETTDSYERQDVHMWLKQPNLRLGITYGF